jgi:hypothetical protein
MTQRVLFTLIAACVAAFTFACQGGSADQPMATGKAGDLTVSITGPGGQLRKGSNNLTLTFTDASGKGVDVGSASLGFHMPAMGTMAEMNNKAALTTTETPGKYRAEVNIDMLGTWEAQVRYLGQHGSGDARMQIQAK